MKKIEIKQKVIEKDSNIIWNEFIDFACNALDEGENLSEIQNNAVLCFWYHSEMCSGGHSGYFDCYPNVSSQDLLKAMQKIGATKCIENFTTAIQTGESDGYEETDRLFYELESDFLNLLQSYIEKNINEFFEIK